MGDAAFRCFQVSTVRVVHADRERPWIIENMQRKSHGFFGPRARRRSRSAASSIDFLAPTRPPCVLLCVCCVGGCLVLPPAEQSRSGTWYAGGRSSGARPRWDVCRPSFPRCYTMFTSLVFRQLPAQLKLLTTGSVWCVPPLLWININFNIG